MKVDEALAILRYELQQKPELITVFHVIQDALDHWGASAVTHPEYVAEQKRKTEELRSRLDQLPVAVVAEKRMSYYDLKIHSNPDAQAWAKFFIKTKKEENWRIKDIDEPLMLAWFANAMMAMHDHLESQRTWAGLTEERIKEIWLNGKDHGDDWLDVLGLAKAFDAELKELNT